jgi:bacteriocin biosynthesis cyclodehydratase domain-containing protein
MSETATTPDHDDPELAVAAGIDLVLLSEDEVLVQFGSRSHPSELLRDADLTGLLGTLARRLLDGSVVLGELVAAVREQDRDEARKVVLDLLERGILTDVRRDPVEQYLRYTFDDAQHLERRAVSVLGSGALADRIASSLGEHPLAVDRLDGDVDLESAQGAARTSDLLMLALDRPSPGLAHVVNRVCLQTRTPWLLATIDGSRGLTGPLFAPPNTACYNDYRTLVEATTPSAPMVRRYERWARANGRPRAFAGLPAYADIVAGFASLAAVHFLSRGTSFAIGRQLLVDFERMRIDVEDVLKLPRCPVCGPARSGYRPAFVPEVVEDPADAFRAAVPAE